MKIDSSKKELAHEALQEPKTVAKYLHAIAEGLEAGNLRLTSGDVVLECRPGGLVGFELAAKRDGGKWKLRIGLAWREERPPEGEPALEISAG